MKPYEVLLVSTVVLIVAFLTGLHCGSTAMKRKAVEAGAAEWVVENPLTGGTELRWKVAKETKE